MVAELDFLCFPGPPPPSCLSPPDHTCFPPIPGGRGAETGSLLLGGVPAQASSPPGLLVHRAPRVSFSSACSPPAPLPRPHCWLSSCLPPPCQPRPALFLPGPASLWSTLCRELPDCHKEEEGSNPTTAPQFLPPQGYPSGHIPSAVSLFTVPHYRPWAFSIHNRGPQKLKP